MTRTAIYARFSTELQQERSIEDQFALCRMYAAKNGLEVVDTYEDRARSGASIYGREGLMRLLDAARKRQFDIVLTEALDRLSRDQRDLAGVWKLAVLMGAPKFYPNMRVAASGGTMVAEVRYHRSPDQDQMSLCLPCHWPYNNLHNVTVAIPLKIEAYSRGARDVLSAIAREQFLP